MESRIRIRTKSCPDMSMPCCTMIFSQGVVVILECNVALAPGENFNETTAAPAPSLLCTYIQYTKPTFFHTIQIFYKG
jgi:hypothetical protein